jgi:hypothetical protein
MFSLQTLFGKGDRFYQLLEDAAREAHESVRLVIEMIKSPDSAKRLDDLALTRRKEKKIAEQISAELVKTFVTGLEREDIEALALALYKIPKTVRNWRSASTSATSILTAWILCARLKSWNRPPTWCWPWSRSFAT